MTVVSRLSIAMSDVQNDARFRRTISFADETDGSLDRPVLAWAPTVSMDEVSGSPAIGLKSLIQLWVPLEQKIA